MTSEAAPCLRVRPVSVTPAAEPGSYEIRWRLDNLSDAPIQILESWLPHSQFFGPRQSVQATLEVPAHRGGTIRRSVRLPSAPALVVENAFLNLRVQYQGHPWRVLTRLCVERQASDSVSVTVEAITAHRVGFAEAVAKEQR